MPTYAAASTHQYVTDNAVVDGEIALPPGIARVELSQMLANDQSLSGDLQRLRQVALCNKYVTNLGIENN